MRIQIPRELIGKKYIRVNKHPDLDLYIYNYTQAAQFERVWNEHTLMCRGLVLDFLGNIVARPIPKFFNYEEPEVVIPEGEMEIFEKLDGSLIEIFKWQDNVVVASRGSFTSDVAIHARHILETKHADFMEKMIEGKTYIFEYIVPQNRIVVDYGTKEDLVLLTIMDNETADESADYDLGFEVVKKLEYPYFTLAQLQELDMDNEEGFVIRIGKYRVKVKFANYVEKHRMVTGVNEKSIWGTLYEGGTIKDIIKELPDELHRWANSICSQLIKEYNGVEKDALSDYDNVVEELKMFYSHRVDQPTDDEYQREFAERVGTEEHRSILFKMKNGADYSEIIWRMIKPKMTAGFSGMGQKLGAQD